MPGRGTKNAEIKLGLHGSARSLLNFSGSLASSLKCRQMVMVESGLSVISGLVFERMGWESGRVKYPTAPRSHEGAWISKGGALRIFIYETYGT